MFSTIMISMYRGLGTGGVGPPLESGIYVVKFFLKIFLIYSDPPG